MANQGYNTKARKSIVEFCKKNDREAFSAEDIYNALLEEGVKINITTVYRTLSRLAENGTVVKYGADDAKKALYRYRDDDCCDHLHLQCSECGKIIHLDCEYMNGIIEHIKNNHNFDLRCDKSILFGRCAECRAKDSVDKNKK